jgi:hypothetical protein
MYPVGITAISCRNVLKEELCELNISPSTVGKVISKNNDGKEM